MRVGIAADHGGFALKEQIAASLREAGYELVDFGAYVAEHDDDYPDFVIPLAARLPVGTLRAGSLCAAAVSVSRLPRTKSSAFEPGSSMTSFRLMGVEDDDMNVFALGGNVIGAALAQELIHVFLGARFSGAERHRRRIAKVQALEIPSPSLQMYGAPTVDDIRGKLTV
jgi:ribose 5-phosphate isomerase B